MANIVAGEELAQDAAVRESADAIAILGALGHFESSIPDTQVAIADVHPRPGGRGERVNGFGVAPPVLTPPLLSR